MISDLSTDYKNYKRIKGARAKALEARKATDAAKEEKLNTAGRQIV